jgi:alpha-glucoside transport system ATP-binding protein
MNLLGGKIVGTGEVTTLELPKAAARSPRTTRRARGYGRERRGRHPARGHGRDRRENYAFHGTVDIVEALGEVTQLYFDTPSADHEPTP